MKGMLRRVSSTSSEPLWCEARKQHRLLLEQHAGFAVLENVFDDAAGLVAFVAHGDKARFRTRCPFGPKVLSEMLLCQIDDAIRCEG